jgi:hypothetical protein
VVVVLVVVAGVAGLGFYRGWFGLTSTTADGKASSTFTVDTDNFQEDKQDAIGNVQDLGQQGTPKVAPGSAANDAAEATHDGTVVRVTGGELVMLHADGQEQSHALAADVAVTCDGTACQTVDLKPGMRIRVTTKIDDPGAATRIEALDRERDFKKAA